ncbi:hypothetical protein GTO91_02410 [Heliobacterium undosum]|uniref:Uncharacterized protein n=1 Tax=Heliomicrobium undosum TaxID=121734 RepID=A0A845L495_9FIRM|nr:hypothetical protein [Heliomicrobium undosum]MZP28578.1 hypothetical protein [Heliomicrobium undosum]
MGMLVKLFQRRGSGWNDPSPGELSLPPGLGISDQWNGAGYEGFRKPGKQEPQLYDEEERRMLRDINLSLIIIKMTFQLADDRRFASSMVARHLQPFVVLDMDKSRKSYLQLLAQVARDESANFATRAGFESFEALGRRWQKSGKDLYDQSLLMGPMGDQFESKLQHILRKFAKAAQAPYLTVVTRLPAEPLRIEIPRFQVIRPFVIGGIPCASFEDARLLAQTLAPAVARDEKDGLIEHFTSHYID